MLIIIYNENNVKSAHKPVHESSIKDWKSKTISERLHQRLPPSIVRIVRRESDLNFNEVFRNEIEIKMEIMRIHVHNFNMHAYMISIGISVIHIPF